MMIISLKDSNKKNLTKDFDIEFDGNSFGYDDVVFTKPVKAKGVYKVIRGSIELEADLTTRLRHQCSRCLKEFEEDLELHVEERFSDKVSEDDYDTIQLSEGEDVDITDILTKDIISSLQIQSLCNEDCMGLCQKCGANLNDAACDCDTEQVDMRLEALKDLLEEV